MHELQLYDFHARMLDNTIPGFTTPDPLAEQHPWESPYQFCGNNPVNRIDATGLDWYAYSKGVSWFENMHTRVGFSYNNENYKWIGEEVNVANTAGDRFFGDMYGNLTKVIDIPEITVTPDGNYFNYLTGGGGGSGVAEERPLGQGGGGHSALDYAGLLAGGADTYFGVRGEAVHNSMYWVQKNGTVRLASAAKSNVLYKNSYKVVGNLTSASKIASASFAGVGTVISGVQFVSNPTYANAFDAAMGLTSFIPVAGWAISGTYFIANIGCQIITDKTLGQQIFGDTKVY